MRFGSVSSGIEAASVAWGPLGWRAAWLSEIAPFPSQLLAHRYPDVPNLGDMTALPSRIRRKEVEAPDALCGGTPCQAFSVAGKRQSLDDARGNLSLIFCEIADAIDHVRLAAREQPCVVFWENVPGVLSTKDNAFGCFLAGLAGDDTPLEPEPCPAPGKSSRYWRWSKKDGAHAPAWPLAGVVSGPTRTVAWRVLDAQYFGVAQRRRRVFVVASARDDFDPAAALFEFEGGRRDSAPPADQRDMAEVLVCGCGYEFSDSLGAYGCANCEGDEGPAVAAPTWWDGGNISQTLDAVLYKKQALPEKTRFPAVMWRGLLRFITPKEAERLQGFPDDYTLIPVRGKPAADGPRYKALGNSWAVPCVYWIGQRIDAQLLRADNDNTPAAEAAIA